MPLAGLLGFLALSGSAMADTTNTTQVMSSYQTAIIPLEGGAQGFQAQSPNGNNLGAFQLGQAALQDAGYKNADGSWTATAQAQGVNSNTDFLNNPQAQIAADNAYNAKNTSYMGSSYLGTTDPYSGTTLDSGSLAYCSESLGAGGCKSYLATGVIPAVDLSQNPQWRNGGWQANLKTMSSTSTTDSGSVDVATTTNSSGTSSSTSVSGVFCDPAIAAMVQNQAATMIQSWTTLASRPETGYTLVGGQSVLEAAGLLTQGQPGYVGSSGLFGSAGGSYAQASCLSRLTNSGLNIVFAPPSIGNILSTLVQAACNEANALFSQVTAPISQSVYQAFSMNGLVPGLNLGSIGGTANISVGSGGSGLINVNGGATGSESYTPSTGWYATGTGSGSSMPANSYGNLFGSSSTSSTGIVPGGLY